MKNRREEMRNVWCSPSTAASGDNGPPSFDSKSAMDTAAFPVYSSSSLFNPSSFNPSVAGQPGLNRLPPPPPLGFKPSPFHPSSQFRPSTPDASPPRFNGSSPGFSLTPLNIVEPDDDDIADDRDSESPISDVEITQ